MRKPMVTRTITTTKAIVLCVDVQNGESCNEVVTLPRTYKDDAKLLKAVQGAIDTDTKKAVHVVSSEVVETLYGMSEADFIVGATELDKETRKAIEEEEVQE